MTKNIILGLSGIMVLTFSGCAHFPSEKPGEISPAQAGSVPPADSAKDAVDSEALQHFMDAQMMMSQGNYALAAIELQDALLIDPKVSTIHVSLAECYWNLGKMDRAHSHLEKAIEIDPEDHEAREMLAHHFFIQKKYPEATKQYKVLFELTPNNPEYSFALGDLYRLQKKYDTAIDWYEKTYYMNTDWVEALERAAELALGTKNLDKAEDIYKELIETDDTNSDYLKPYSDIAVLNNHIDAGIKSLQQLMNVEGKSSQILNRIGMLHVEADKPDSAESVFLDVLSTDSLNQATLHFLSTLYRNQEDYPNAITYAEKLAQHYPHQPQGLIDQALIFMVQNKYEQTIDVLAPVADTFDEDYTIQFLLGNAYYLLKESEEAEQYLTRAVDIYPESRSSWHTLAIIYDNSQRFAESDQVYEQLIESDSTDAQAFNNYAYSLSERNTRLEYALNLAKKAIALAPETAAYLDTIGWIYFKLGKLDLAVEYIRQAVDLDKTNAVLLEHLGDIWMQKKAPEKALTYYEQALDLDLGNEQLQSKISDLR